MPVVAHIRYNTGSSIVSNGPWTEELHQCKGLETMARRVIRNKGIAHLLHPTLGARPEGSLQGRDLTVLPPGWGLDRAKSCAQLGCQGNSKSLMVVQVRMPFLPPLDRFDAWTGGTNSPTSG